FKIIQDMKTYITRWFLLLLLPGVFSLRMHAAEMVIESLSGPVTPKEISAFKAFMQTQPTSDSNNHNGWVYGSSGKNTEALGMVYEISHDQGILDQMIRYADAALASRNSATNGRIIWTGKRELCWPNSPSN